jgi:predicted nucleic acid-binding protein
VTERFVLDANPVIKAFAPKGVLAPEEEIVAAASRRFIARAVSEGAALHVPFLFFSEVLNTISRFRGAGAYSDEQAELILTRAFGLPLIPALPQWRSVYSITRALGRNKTGDSEFIAVALMTNSVLITADEALKRNIDSVKATYPVESVMTHPWSQ